MFILNEKLLTPILTNLHDLNKTFNCLDARVCRDYRDSNAKIDGRLNSKIVFCARL